MTASLKGRAAAWAAALVFAIAADASAQTARPIRAREAAQVQAQDVHHLVAQLRPDWLLAGGDPADPASAGRVRVYVGRTIVGGLEALVGMPTANLHSIRLESAEAERQLDSRTGDMRAVLRVRFEDPNATQAPPRRVQVTAGIGGRGLLDERAIDVLRDAGWESANSQQPWTDFGPDDARSLFAAVAVRLRGNTGVAVNAFYTNQIRARGVKPTEDWYTSLTNRFATADVAATAFAGTRYVRVGVGPALRVLNYEQGLGGCGCQDLEEGRKMALGAAADAALIFPPTGLVHLQLTGGVRWFAPHGIEGRSGAPDTELGGLTAYTAVGLGFAF